MNNESSKLPEIGSSKCDQGSDEYSQIDALLVCKI
jgi:hypothetical protein